MDPDSDNRDLNALTAAAVRMLRLSHETLERAADLVLWIGPDGLIRRANQAAQRLLGLEPQALLRRPLASLLAPPALAAGALQSVAPARALWVARGDSPCLVELSLLGAGGEALPVELALSHVELGDEQLNCAIVRDLSERKRAEQALRTALDEVQQLKARLEAENVYLRDEIKADHDFEDIVGASEPLRRVLKHVEQVARTDATVLILGESGTGKELIARAIHERSDRKTRALVKVNCAALPANLIESELFGHERGAFTGALQRRVGRFELADRGTLFLDEIGELPLELQSKLLRVLQEGEFERLGDPRTLRVDVRVLAATNQELERAVGEGRFRQDLYYRLNVFPIRVPALRERGEDIALLARHFALKYAQRVGKPVRPLSEAMHAGLARYAFPGNIRELENLVERAVILSDGPALELDEPLERAAPVGAPGPGGQRTLREVEVALMREALAASRWVIGGKKGAAARLDMAPSTLRERMQRYGIRRDEGEG
jgi:formate hydrogenlyase transcriptional activator